MSTKTTFKRIALVAVAALGLGVLTSIAPASASTALTPFIAGGASTGTPVGDGTATMKMYQLAGANNYASLVVGTATTATLSPNYDFVSVSGSVFTAGTGNLTAIDSAKTTVVIAAAGALVGNQLWVATPTAGTITVKYISRTYSLGIATDTTNQTISIVVGSSDVDAVASTAVVNSGSTTAGATDDAVIAPKGSTTVIANVELTMLTLLGTPYSGAGFTASVSGPGLIANDNDGTPSNIGTSKVATLTFSPGGKTWITVTGDGLAGTATITISVGGTAWKTKTVIFSGTAAKYVVDATTPSTVVSLLGVGHTQAWNLSTVDAAGNAVQATPPIFAVSSDTSILTVDTTTTPGTVIATGVKAGTATFTVCDTALCASPTITLGPVSVKVTNVTASAATFTLDKADYSAGEAFTLTITASDSNGGLADGTYNGMATLTTSVLVNSTTGGLVSGTQNPEFTNGKATVPGFMPQGTGVVTFTLTLGTNGVATAAQGAKLTATANVGSAAVDAATAATDAAAEATDAANAATDAANAAAEAADAATAAAQDAADAVAALSAQVATLISGLKAQLTALTNLVIKIQKKVKA